MTTTNEDDRLRKAIDEATAFENEHAPRARFHTRSDKADDLEGAKLNDEDDEEPASDMPGRLGDHPPHQGSGG